MEYEDDPYNYLTNIWLHIRDSISQDGRSSWACQFIAQTVKFPDTILEAYEPVCHLKCYNYMILHRLMPTLLL
jgi:hypothetical protein